MATISPDQAFQVAATHAAGVSLEHPDYKMECQFEADLPDGWLFQYRIKCLRDLPPEQQEHFAGAAAFVVHKNGQISQLSVPIYYELKERLARRDLAC
jgi:hypothetical protein